MATDINNGLPLQKHFIAHAHTLVQNLYNEYKYW